jgi:hypothetical protein
VDRDNIFVEIIIIILNGSDGCKNEKKQKVVLETVTLQKISSLYLNCVSELGTQKHVAIGNNLFLVIHCSATRTGLIIP